ncbi:MAG: hypothetical protein QOI78_8790 [Actinomycetota bacterium]|nr:hypothetical protein [Actinomycetota bacterium]
MSSQQTGTGCRVLPVWAFLVLVAGYVEVTGLIGWAATIGIDVAWYAFCDQSGPVESAADAVARHLTAEPSVQRL